MSTILVVEDEVAIRELLRFSLEQAGFSVVLVGSAEEAFTEVRDALPDIMLVDLMLPGLSGLALAKQIRSDPRTRELPLIMVTARADEPDRVAGLDTGADDYVTKPFSPRELIARIRAVLRRRAPQHSGEPVQIGAVRLDPVAYTASYGERELELGPTEFKLLHFFLTHPNRVYTRDQLLNAIRGDHRFLEERTVDVYIRRLRSCLGPDGERLIETVRGVGYKLSARAE